MGTQQGTTLHTDTDGKRTSAVWADDGTGSTRWLLWVRNAILERLEKAVDAAYTAGDRGLMALAVRRDTAAASSATTGDYEPLQTDALGRLRTLARRDPTDSLSMTANAAQAASLVVKASPGTLHSIVGYVATGEDGWIQVHDAITAPSNGAVPEVSYFVPAASAPQPVNVPLPGHVCGTGITLCWSTTGPTLTAGSANMMVAAHYE